MKISKTKLKQIQDEIFWLRWDIEEYLNESPIESALKTLRKLEKRVNNLLEPPTK